MIRGVAHVMGMKPTFRSFFLQRAFLLRHGLQAGDGQHAGNGGHGRAFADRAQKAAAHIVFREQGLDQAGFNELVAVSLEFRGQAARAQHFGGIGGIGLNSVF